MNEPSATTPQIPRIPLRGFAEDDRFRSLDTSEAYYYGQQDAHKRYDWDGNFGTGGHQASTDPGFLVTHAERRPCARYDLAKVVVNRLTEFTFGDGHFPEVRIEGDEAAEDYARTLVTESRLKVRLSEARKYGGSCGTAVLSFGFVDGKPRVRVHKPKYIKVLEWRDEEELVPERVVKAMSYPRLVYDAKAEKFKMKDFWTVTYWDEQQVIKWKGIPDEVAKKPEWQNWTSAIFEHNYGFCPVYWVQNKPDSSEIDGEGDFEGQEATLDQINQLLSSTTKGTKANVDPTLVIHAPPSANNGTVRKGSSNAIFCAGGAEYLELKGTAVAAAERQLERLRAYVLDVCGVVLAEAEKLAGAAQSARALEILYAPMLANCDTLREQYGEHGIKPIIRDMLRVARQYLAAPARELKDGTVVQTKVLLPPRMERVEVGDGHEERPVERLPGTSEQISLNWRPYFPPTWADIRNAVAATKEANGGKPMVSHRTSVQQLAPMFGIENVDTEMDAINEDQERAVEAAQQAFESQSLFDNGDEPGDKTDDDSDAKEK